MSRELKGTIVAVTPGKGHVTVTMVLPTTGRVGSLPVPHGQAVLVVPEVEP